MKTCENCYWCGRCSGEGRRCEYYDPVEGAENIAEREYLDNLDERAKHYDELLREQQDICGNDV